MLPEHNLIFYHFSLKRKHGLLTISYFRSTQLPRLFCSSSPGSGEERPTQKFEGFVPVYRFPYVAPAVLFTKFKIAQTAVVTLGLAPYYVYQVSKFDKVTL